MASLCREEPYQQGKQENDGTFVSAQPKAACSSPGGWLR
jgi:hypothetical protein